MSTDQPVAKIEQAIHTTVPVTEDDTLVDDTVALVDDPTALVGGPTAVVGELVGKAEIKKNQTVLKISR
jgi:hypothetical protein